MKTNPVVEMVTTVDPVDRMNLVEVVVAVDPVDLKERMAEFLVASAETSSVEY